MADPFSTFAGVAGVAALALEATKSLINDIKAIRDAPATVKKLERDLDALTGVLQSLETCTKDSLKHLGTDATAALAASLENCKSSCEGFQTKLKRWMKHSTADHMHWMDRVRIGIIADKNVETLSKQLLQCKLTSSVAISTMTLSVYLVA